MKSAFTPLLAVAILVSSCKKNNNSANGLASLTIVQANFDIPAVYVYFASVDTAFYAHQATIPFGVASEYATAPNSSLIILSSNDSTRRLLNTTLNLSTGGIYSLYLAGNGQQMDTLLMRDELPLHTDSSSGARFINLSSGSNPIKVNLLGNDPAQTEFTGLGYKQISLFKNYSGTGGVTTYTFEVRDQMSDSLLTTFTWNISLFKNSTLVISGSEDPSGAYPISVFPVNNF